jgi:hypothetical protein
MISNSHCNDIKWRYEKLNGVTLVRSQQYTQYLNCDKDIRDEGET